MTETAVALEVPASIGVNWDTVEATNLTLEIDAPASDWAVLNTSFIVKQQNQTPMQPFSCGIFIGDILCSMEP